MTFQELYTRLIKYDVILENPDTAYFCVENEDGDTEVNGKFSYAVDAWTFIIMGGVLFYCDSDLAYHGQLMSIVDKAIFRDNRSLPPNVYSIGDFAPNALEKYKNIFASIDYPVRTDVLYKHPEIIQGRFWIDEGYTLVSIWNKLERLTPKNIKLIKNLTKKGGRSPDKIYIEVGEDDPSININDLFKPEQNISQPDFDPTIVHLADPKNKRELLLKQGARPKTPIGIKQKQMMNMEDVRR